MCVYCIQVRSKLLRKLGMPTEAIRWGARNVSDMVTQISENVSGQYIYVTSGCGKGDGRETNATKYERASAGLESLRRISFQLSVGSICVSQNPSLRPHSPHRVWCTQLEATCSMWLQLSSMCLIFTRRMCSGVQQTLAGSLVIPMSPTGRWPTVPPVFW